MLEFEVRPRDMDILRSIRTHMTINSLSEFSADDLFALGLDRFLADTQHGAGAWFATMQHNRLIRPVGWKRSTRESNHMRMIRTYQMEKTKP